ncbi:hypothetical protein AMTR_s00086p00100090, partial [Amborella trichopoda]
LSVMGETQSDEINTKEVIQVLRADAKEEEIQSDEIDAKEEIQDDEIAALILAYCREFSSNNSEYKVRR